MSADPRIPEAVRNAKLTGLRLVTAEQADAAFTAYVEVNARPISPPHAPRDVSYFRYQPVMAGRLRLLGLSE